MIEVVAAALVRDGLVLAAHRSSPPVGWEFPGGKVEAGESPREALVREIREELGAGVVVIDQLGTAVDSAHTLTLTLLRCELGEGEPTAGPDHDELRWLTAGELPSVAWLSLDAGFLDAIRPHLSEN